MRKRVKMKPPWPVRCSNQDGRSSKSDNLPSAVISSIVVGLIVCCLTARQVASFMDSHRLGDSISLQTSTNEIDAGGNSSSESQATWPSLAHFNTSKMPKFVIASSYQTEVYLPCQILNLDNDQTVSSSRLYVQVPLASEFCLLEATCSCFKQVALNGERAILMKERASCDPEASSCTFLSPGELGVCSICELGLLRLIMAVFFVLVLFRVANLRANPRAQLYQAAGSRSTTG